MNTASVKHDLLTSLKADPEFRHAWNLENVYTGLCFQIRALREQRGWSQAVLGKTARMAQERISILEDPNSDTKPTLNTLLRIADAYDVGLDVRFVSYGTVLDRSTHTNMRDLTVPSFEDELPELGKELAEQELSENVIPPYALPAQPIVPFSEAARSDISASLTNGQPAKCSPDPRQPTEPINEESICCMNESKAWPVEEGGMTTKAIELPDPLGLSVKIVPINKHKPRNHTKNANAKGSPRKSFGFGKVANG